MIAIICEQLKQKVSTLPFADKIAGLVKVAVRRIETQLDDGSFVKIEEQKFPIASNVLGVECWGNGINGQYKDLAPNSQRKSIIYFEQLTPEGIGISQLPKHKALQGRVRLVCWLNMKKLGIVESDVNCVTFQIKNMLLSMLVGKTIATCGGLTIAAETKAISIVNDPSVFSKYSYQKDIIDNMLLYPYQYFAIDFDVYSDINSSCFIFNPQTEIIC